MGCAKLRSRLHKEGDMKQWIALLCSVFITPAFSQSADKTATLVFINGNVYTANEAQPQAQAVAVNKDRIVFVGTNDEAKKYESTQTKIIDLHGATMLPGLTDAHYHFIEVGEREMHFNLEGTKSLDELLSKLKERVAKAKPGEWITGSNWIETDWKPSKFPTRWDLDRVAPNNPVMLTRSDYHSAVVNSAALKRARINKRTKDPFGGKILRDAKTGEPDGMLVDEAQALVNVYIPEPNSAAREKAALLADKVSIEYGLTQVQEPGGTYGDVELYKKLYAAGKIHVRIYKAVMGPGKDADRLLREGPIIEAFDNHFNLRAIKVLSDGALGSRGAYLLAPYNDAQTSGFLTVKEKPYRAMLRAALKNGIQVMTHAIGDAANRFTLDEYEHALRDITADRRKIADPRWRVEHAQIIAPIDIPRFAALGVIPSMQPSHAIGDLHFAEQRLGLDRLAGAYAWQSLIKAGSIIPGGSDAPVERGNPMIEFYAAVARKDLHGYSAEGWHPEQVLTRDQALKMFTVWPAYAAFEENLRGSIEPGKLADFTVLSADIMKIPEAEILQVHVVMTVIGGKVVYQRPGRHPGI